ncbi:MAG: (2Fe-2S) ferredoxin domain-containing protein [Firmicutes bacterium]|jgi:NADH:ubiquinone oxidoreductase subunit E|nr:(2Fe-2S) ferredoxin domain-containing protein [Bacillota bacterium]
MIIEVCVGSSCYIRGAPAVISILQSLIAKYGLEEKVILKGSFCMQQCTQGVTVRIDGVVHSGLGKEDASRLFHHIVLPSLEAVGGED